MKALITGITGQDGSYLAEYLLSLGYEVHGLIRRSSMENSSKLLNLQNCIEKIVLHTVNLEDHLSVYKLVHAIKPDECYHLSAASFVSYDFSDEINTISANFNTTHYLLSSIKEACLNCKFYFAGSSEMFGETKDSPQTETTNFNPRSIYGISKLSSYYVIKNYRERYNMFACTGIMYNHESIRRGHSFVTRKITSSVAKIKKGLINKLELGNIDAIRDWGYAPDYVKAFHSMLNLTTPDDYILSTGIGHTVSDFLDIAFSYVDLNYKDFVVINDNFYRPSEKVALIGNNNKIKNNLGFKQTKGLKEIVEEMVDHDIWCLK